MVSVVPGSPVNPVAAQQENDDNNGESSGSEEESDGNDETDENDSNGGSGDSNDDCKPNDDDCDNDSGSDSNSENTDSADSGGSDGSDSDDDGTLSNSGNSDDGSSPVNENKDEQSASQTSDNKPNDQRPTHLPSPTDELNEVTPDVPTTNQNTEEVSSAATGESQGAQSAAPAIATTTKENTVDADSLQRVTTNIDNQQRNRFLLSKDAHSLLRENIIKDNQQLSPFPFVPGLTGNMAPGDQSILPAQVEDSVLCRSIDLSRWQPTCGRTMFSSHW